MEKQITLEQAGTACGKINSMIKKTTSMLNAPLRLLGRYYSYVIERNLDMRQTKAITEAQMAFFATILPVEKNAHTAASGSLHLVYHVAEEMPLSAEVMQPECMSAAA